MATGNRIAKRALMTAVALAAVPTAAFGQSITVQQVPLADTFCSGTGQSPRPLNTCTVDGTRTNSTPVITTAPVDANRTRVTHTEDVTFSGNLAVSGVPVSFTPGSVFPWSADQFFGNANTTVSAATEYTGSYSMVVSNASVPAVTSTMTQPSAQFLRYNIKSLDVSSINVDIRSADVFDVSTGTEYTYDLSSIDPQNISGNATALRGRYTAGGDGGPIVFGVLTGSATVISAPADGNILTTPGDRATAIGGWASPFAMQYDVQAVETTRLDETGLVTPTVAVTDGIQMNGSRVSGLGDGVNPDDAVNKAQLDAEAATRAQIDLQLSQRIATATANSNALTGALSSETNARMAADLALQNQLGAIGTRLGNLETRIAVMDDRIASSTATAVAMSGNAFLPDMKFNLTANVATYDGAHAASLQIGALVSPHVAVNAGVATGFNRHGKTAGRVGMTFGW